MMSYMVSAKLMALYGGPDQLMPITSGLAAVFAFLLMFWNRVVGVFGRVMNALARKGTKDTVHHSGWNSQATDADLHQPKKEN